MTNAGKTELGLISLPGLAVWLMPGVLPASIGMGSLLLWASALLLLQGLLRDLWLLARQQPTRPQIRLRCMCIESTVGLAGVIAGLVILGSVFDWMVSMETWIWSLLLTLVLLSGFVIKDYVFVWPPLRIRKVKNHGAIVFAWRD